MSNQTDNRYEPNFTQLPIRFIDKNINLRKLIRKKGSEYLGFYIAIQDCMALHSEEDFTLSFEEMRDAICEELFLYNTDEDVINDYLHILISADVIKKKYFINPIDNLEMERYYIPSVAESLEESRDAWLTKCINPSKLPQLLKEKINEHRQRVKEIDKDIRQLAQYRNRLEARLDLALSESTVDADNAKVIRLELDKLRKENASLYKEKRIHEDSIFKIRLNKGGDEDEN